MQRGKRTCHRDDAGGLAAEPVRPQATEPDAGLLREPQLALAPTTLGPHEEAHRRPDNRLDGLQAQSVVQEHASLPHLRQGVLERHRLGNFWHVEPERLARGGLGHPPPPADLSFARVHDAAFGQEGRYARGPDLGGLLYHEVHPSSFGHGLVERDLKVVTGGRRQLLYDDRGPPAAQLGNEEPLRAIYDLEGVPGPATQNLEDVVGLCRRQFQRRARL
jgi:hypothetical protein